MINLAIAFLTGVLGPVLIIIVKDYLKNRRKTDPFEEAVANGTIINDQLEKIQEAFTTDRVWIAQFHNGGYFYPTGQSIQKFSIFFECARQLKDSIRANFQNIPVNLISKAFAKILSDNYIIISDYKDEATATYGLKYIAEEHGTKSSYLFAVRTVSNKLVAVLVVEYTNKKKTLNESEIVAQRLEATKLGGVISGKVKQP